MKKRGPKPKPAEQVRSRAIGIALTEAEYEALTCRSLSTGRSLADVLRDAALRPAASRGDSAPSTGRS